VATLDRVSSARLARTPAVVMLVVGVVAFVVLAAVLVPWDWVPGGSLPTVPANAVFTRAEVARAESYSSLVRHLSWAGYGVSLVVALVLGLTPLGARLARLFGPLAIPLGVLAVLLVGRLATLPFDLVIRHQQLSYGLTHQSLTGWLRDSLVSLGIAWLMFTIGIGLLVLIACRTPRWWFAWAAGLAVALTVVLSFLYPVVVEPLFNSFTPMPAGPLRTAILHLADEEGVDVDDVLVADASRRTTTLNAYVSGFGDTRRVVVYDNLLADLDDRDIEVVVAHELGHARHNDVLLGTAVGAAGAVVGVALLALLLDLPALQRRAAVSGAGDPAVAALVIALVAAGTFLASPVQNAMSRAIEARADRVSLLATRDEAAFVDVQRQLAVHALQDPTPPRLSQLWFGSHPTPLQRVGIAEALLGRG
jgi:STE24 endopeptidase